MFIRAYFTEGLSEELSLGIGIRSAWFVDETGALPQPPHQVPLGFWWEQKYPIQHLMIPERGNTRLARWPTCQTVFCTSVVWFPLFCLVVVVALRSPLYPWHNPPAPPRIKTATFKLTGGMLVLQIIHLLGRRADLCIALVTKYIWCQRRGVERARGTACK